MRLIYFILALALLTTLSVSAQTDPLIAYYSFDDGDASETRGRMEFNGFVNGNPQLACGVAGNSLLLDGSGDYLTFAGPINQRFEGNDFVVSFYFHPTGVSPRQTLLRKHADCDDQNQRLSIDYLPNENAIEFVVAESIGRELGGPTERVPLNPDRCWHHIVMERNNREVTIYLNGLRVKRVTGNRRLNIASNFNLEIGRSGCPTTESNFKGFIDELKIFSGSLSLDEIEALYLDPDRIADVAFPVVNQGTEVDLSVVRSCANSFTWTPTASIIAGRNTPMVTVAPTMSTSYEVELGYPQSGCRARDSVLIQVFNADNFDCTQLYLPTAFTPNGLGPEQNNTFGISNAATLQTFEQFEIYDRWGNMVFVTNTASETWDGTYAGEPAMPGVYLWRVAYGCNDEELDKTGSVMLIR